jgi:hypothetical protein
MNIAEDIHWHDSLILGVRITPEKDRIEMKLLYPENWRSNSFAERTVVFENAYGYKEFEGPFEGSPTILSAEVVARHERWSQVRIETNAGYREVFCEAVSLKSR